MKKYKNSYNYGKRVTNPYTMIISTAIFCLWLISGNDYDDTYVREQDPVMKPVVVEQEETVEEKIKRYFPKSHVTMLAVAKAESGLNHKAQNWNCWYNEDKTVVYQSKVEGSHSTSCKKGHRKYSWSIDCGVLMRNYVGVKECPEVTIDEHLQEMAELSKARGFQPWYAWSNGSYKKFLASK